MSVFIYILNITFTELLNSELMVFDILPSD